MKITIQNLLLLICITLANLNLLKGQSEYVYLHGVYTDSDWEELKFIGNDILYSYAQGKTPIKLIKGEVFEMNGQKIRKLQFPKMDKVYYLSNVGNNTLRMSDDKGTYEKYFILKSSIKSESKPASPLPEISLLSTEERATLLSLLPDEELQRGVKSAKKARRSYDGNGDLTNSELIFNQVDGFYFEEYTSYEISFSRLGNGGIEINYGNSVGGAYSVEGVVTKKCGNCMANLTETGFSSGIDGLTTTKKMVQKLEYGNVEWKLVSETTTPNKME